MRNENQNSRLINLTELKMKDIKEKLNYSKFELQRYTKRTHKQKNLFSL